MVEPDSHSPPGRGPFASVIAMWEGNGRSGLRRRLDLVDQVRANLRARARLRSAAHLGRRVRLWGRPWVDVRGDFTVGDRVQFVSTVATLQIVVGHEGRLDIGEQSFVNFGVELAAFDQVTIGPRCLIGSHSIIMDTAFHTVDPERRLEQPPPCPVTIGTRCSSIGTR